MRCGLGWMSFLPSIQIQVVWKTQEKGDDRKSVTLLTCFNDVQLRSCAVFLNMKSWKNKVSRGSRTNRFFSLLQPYMLYFLTLKQKQFLGYFNSIIIVFC